MLSFGLAAALSSLPGLLGSHLLSAGLTRPTSVPDRPDEAASPGFDLEAELARLFPPDEARARAAHARRRGNEALAQAARLGLHAIPFGSAHYPPLLGTITDPPPMLWVRGQLDALTASSIAVVGSRAASPLSLDVAGELARELARRLVVTSGLARGIDAAAHRGALDTGRSVAVLGCGPDVVYPSEHGTLADALAASGALVAELVPGTPPRKDHFPRRNRLISGLSLGVVVVEASLRSGSLITARVALDQGREVMAVPGPIVGGRHRGAHGLLRDGAALVESAADVFAALGLDAGPAAVPAPGGSGGEGAADPILARFEPGQTRDLEDLMALTGRPAAGILRRLLELELAGLVTRIPGGRFFRPASTGKPEVVR